MMPVSESDIPTSILPVIGPPPAGEAAPPPAAAEPQRCDECEAPVDDAQRYCVVCGAHRRHVADPAARYLSQVTARTRSARSPAAGRTLRRARSRGLGIALALCLIPVAAALGVVIGRSSNNGDAQLIQALARRQAQTLMVGAGSAGGATSAGASTATSSARGAAKKATRGHRSTTRAHAAVTQTNNGPVSQVTGFKATKSQEQQGAAVTQKVQKSTGKAYVNQQTNLPSQVVVP
jgi:hypothetical protein